MPQAVKANEIRSFGLIVGGIFSVIGLWPLVFRSESPRFWALVAGGLLILLGIVLPQSLTHIYRIWMKLGHVLGWINTRILLGIIFYGLITPIGLVMRLFGKDPMRRVLTQEVTTYRVIRNPRPRLHMRNQF